jgi:subtilisin-like proprotein convertase family protein
MSNQQFKKKVKKKSNISVANAYPINKLSIDLDLNNQSVYKVVISLTSPQSGAYSNSEKNIKKVIYIGFMRVLFNFKKNKITILRMFIE